MPAEAFFDTNVLVYALSLDDPRSAQAEELLAAGGKISVQILNEFVSVARRKMQMPWLEVREALDAFLILCPSPLPVSVALHQKAVEIAKRHGFGISDALVIAAAIEAGCPTLYSEDFQHGQKIEGKLTILNPFARS